MVIKTNLNEEIKAYNKAYGAGLTNSNNPHCKLCNAAPKEVDSYCRVCFDKLIDKYSPPIETRRPQKPWERNKTTNRFNNRR